MSEAKQLDRDLPFWFSDILPWCLNVNFSNLQFPATVRWTSGSATPIFTLNLATPTVIVAADGFS
jgi:hypothetical protein